LNYIYNYKHDINDTIFKKHEQAASEIKLIRL